MMKLDYSRVKIAVSARKWPTHATPAFQDADAVRLASQKGK